ncbi:MAG: hypothetical protein OXG74_01255 [Acidobacteria bacterium]|nr:hypothetical protein [Acidobacteriota bacterium]
MTNKGDLRAAMLKSGGQTAAPKPAQESRSGRAGKSNVTGYFDPEVKRQLRIMAAEHDCTIQDLVGEALNELFAKHGRPEIAPARAGTSA